MPSEPTPATVHLIDATGYLFRAYHAIGSMKAPDGTPTNAIFGLVQTVLKHAREAAPSHVACAIDASMESFRNTLDATYKANRTAPPEDLERQFDLAEQALDLLGFHPISSEGFEADDVIATLVRRARSQTLPVVVASFDKDLAQLVGDGVRLVDLGRGEPIDAAGVEARFGVPPALVADYLALCGDTVDNVPGVRGVGPKTAAALLRHFGSLDALLAEPERIRDVDCRGRDALVERIRSGAEDARRSRTLTGLRDDVPLAVGIDALRYGGPGREAAAFFERLGFRRLTESLRAGSLFDVPSR
jgi:DNA polymerase I